MKDKKPQLIVALDVQTLEEAKALVEVLAPAVDVFKVGSQLFTAYGPKAVQFIQEKGKEVFLDLKYHDIPNTVSNAVEAAVRSLAAGGKEKRSILMYTMHTVGGEEMMVKAAQSARKTAEEFHVRVPLSLGITVLTSEQSTNDTKRVVLERALSAKKAGLDGVVASVEEVAMLREKLGNDFIIVTPGIRPAAADVGDQKRVATPALAVKSGSNFLVVGRPIVKAADPLKAAREIVKEIEAV